MDLIGWDLGKPLSEFVSPNVLERGRSYDQQRPVRLIDVSDADGLDGLSDAHLVANQDASEHINACLDALLLKMVEFGDDRIWKRGYRLLVRCELAGVVVRFGEL